MATVQISLAAEDGTRNVVVTMPAREFSSGKAGEEATADAILAAAQTAIGKQRSVEKRGARGIEQKGDPLKVE